MTKDILKSQKAIMGDSGYVGTTLRRQTDFQLHYRSENIDQINDRCIDTIVCAAAPAQKWIANCEPEADRKNIERLIGHLKTIQCQTFILISKVDPGKWTRGLDRMPRSE